MPLQQRGSVLDSDSSSANAFPVYYDTDLESEWADISTIYFSIDNNFSGFDRCTQSCSLTVLIILWMQYRQLVISIIRNKR